MVDRGGIRSFLRLIRATSPRLSLFPCLSFIHTIAFNSAGTTRSVGPSLNLCTCILWKSFVRNDAVVAPALCSILTLSLGFDAHSILRMDGHAALNSSDQEFDVPENLYGNNGNFAVEKMLDNAFADRMASKKVVKELVFNNGAPGTLFERNRWANMFFGFFTNTLGKT
jgi:hypothetical protein